MTPSDRWLAALEARHFSDLTFQEVARSLRALSSTYVERRERIREGAALSGAGKRAAFALFYGPLHYLLVREIVNALADPGSVGRRACRADRSGPQTLVDLGCGTGSAGAAWAEACDARPDVLAVDVNSWALSEAAQTYREFGCRTRTLRAHAAKVKFPKSPALFLAAFTLNELDDHARASLLPRLLERAAQGDRVLIVEPLAKSALRWWDEWAKAFRDAGGRADEWRFPAHLPPLVAKLDRAAGLKHHQLTGRSLFL